MLITTASLTRRALVLGAAMLPLLTSPSFAQDSYPTKPVRILVPLAAASTVDIVARKLAEDLAAPMGQQFIVENRPGAGGVIGNWKGGSDFSAGAIVAAASLELFDQAIELLNT